MAYEDEFYQGQPLLEAIYRHAATPARARSMEYDPGVDRPTMQTSELERGGTPSWYESMSPSLSEQEGRSPLSSLLDIQPDFTKRPTSLTHPEYVNEMTRPFSPTEMTPAQRVDEQTGDAPDQYEQLIRKYIESLSEPSEIPKPPPLSAMQALSVALNPERSQQLLQHYREPYQVDVQNRMMQDKRRAEAAGLSGELMKHRETVQLRKDQMNLQNTWKMWNQEMAAANAGNVNYNYTIPGMKETAERQSRMDESLINQRNRSGSADPTAMAADKDEYYGKLVDDQRALEGVWQQYLGNRELKGAADPDFERRIQASRQEVESEMAAVKAMTPDDWTLYRQLSGEGKEKFRKRLMNPEAIINRVPSP